MATVDKTPYPAITIVHGQLSGMDAQKFVKVLEARVLASPPKERPAATADLFTDEEHLARLGNERQPLEELETPPGPNGSGMSIALFQSREKDHTTAQNNIHALKSEFLALFNPDQLDLLRIPEDERFINQYSLCELKRRFIVIFGQFRPAELKSIRDQLRSHKADLSKPLEGVISTFNKLAKTLKENKREVPDTELCDDFLTMIDGPSGVYKEAVLVYSRRDADKQTLATLQADVLAEYIRLLAIAPATLTAASSTPTASTSGFAAAAAAAPAATPPTPPAGGAGGGGAGGRGRGGGNNRAANGGTNPQPDGGRPCSLKLVYTNGTVTGILPATHYCSSHGPHGPGYGSIVPHNSRDCTHKDRHHDDAATFAELKGGRRVFCHHADYRKFPHT